MNVIVFLGPSLEIEHARSLLDADYRPPVQRGDIVRAIEDRPSAIGIIDGYFNTTPSVWHKEILQAIANGVRVFGGASMGALRAAELHRFGMRGVGQIFTWYRDGLLEDDDEVAVLHESAASGYRELSVPLVNLRDVVAAAQRTSMVCAATATRLLTIAKEIFYADRTYEAVLARARDACLDADELSRLDQFRRTYGLSLKQQDAIAVLQALKHGAHSVAPSDVDFHLENTVFLEALRNDVRISLAVQAAEAAGDSQPSEQMLRDIRKTALLSLLATYEAARLGIQASDEEIQEAANDFRRANGLLQREQMTASLEEAKLNLDAFAELLRGMVCVRKLERRFGHEIDRRVAQHIRMNALHNVRDTSRRS